MDLSIHFETASSEKLKAMVMTKGLLLRKVEKRSGNCVTKAKGGQTDAE